MAKANLMREENVANNFLVRPEGFEPPTMSLEPTCSIQLSYGRLFSGPVGAGEQNRTVVTTLEKLRSTIELHPLDNTIIANLYTICHLPNKISISSQFNYSLDALT